MKFSTYFGYRSPNALSTPASVVSPGWNPVEYAGRCPNVAMKWIEGSAWAAANTASACACQLVQVLFE